MLKAIAVLADRELRATDDDGALGDHHIAGEYTGLLQLIMAAIIRLNIHGLGAVGPLGMRQQRRHQRGGHQQR